MTFLDEYTYFPPKCQQRQCHHDAGRCFRYRSRGCVEGTCGHANRGLVCGINYELAPVAPVGRQRVDVRQPYGVKVQRADGVREWTFSTQYQTAPEDGGPLTPIGVAQRAAFECRLMHGFYGPLKVSLWAHRGDLEHYRLDPPDDAMVFDFAAQPELQPERPTLRVAD